MRRRLLLFLSVALASLVLLALPLSAQAAGKYAVRDIAGTKVGSASDLKQSVTSPSGKVWKLSGAVAGNEEFQDHGWMMFSGGAQEHVIGTVWKTSSHLFSYFTTSSTTIVGRAVLEGSSWSLQRLVGGTWTKKGDVSAKLHGQTALTALRVLLW